MFGLMPTPRSTALEDGPAKLYRFVPPKGVVARKAAPVLLVPSMINRWYVLDLGTGRSVVEALVNEGFDTWVLDWGVPNDEDRDFSWDDAIARLDRMFRRVRRMTGEKKLSVIGYCMGATLSAIHGALHPDWYASLMSLMGPIDFEEAGFMRTLTDPRWFDAYIAEAGNVAAQQMQTAFFLLHPTQQASKWVTLADRASKLDLEYVQSFAAMETWTNDYVPFPADAYIRYIEELYQQNCLIRGTHQIDGRSVDLKEIICPVMTVVAERDQICPPKAATALVTAVGSTETRVLSIPGGHVGAVVGSKAKHRLYPELVTWLKETTCN